MTSRKKKLLWQVPFLLLLIVGTILIIRQQQAMPYQKNTGNIFGTTYTIVYQSDKNLQSDIVAELANVDQTLSAFNPNSVISRINRNEDVECPEMFTEVFNLAQQISRETGGAFDITVAPLVNLWGFGFKTGSTPSPEAVDSLKPFVGYQKVEMTRDGYVRKADARTMLDCSAIAKGYGVDRVARLLRQHDLQNFMVEIGGEVVTHGKNQDQKPWKIGVAKPSDQPDGATAELQTILNITDKAMATSGNYRNFYYKGGKKYAHTIDPQTGFPVQHSLLSATVIAPTCATADAYATAFMVMGTARAQTLLKKHPELKAYLIYTDSNGRMQTWQSPEMDKYINQ